MPYSYSGRREDVTEGNFELIPKGDYWVECCDFKDKKTKAGLPMISAAFKITTQGEGFGRWVWHNVTLIPQGEKGYGMVLHFLKQMQQPYEGNFIVDPSNWIGQQIRVKIGTEEYQGEQKNVIKNIYSEIKDDDAPPVDSLKEVQAEARAIAADGPDGDDIPF